MKKTRGCPNLIIIGNTAYDTKEYVIDNAVRERDVGGACLYSAIPASIFFNVGIVTKIGNDFDINLLKAFNLNISGLQSINTKTTHFYTKFFSKDGQDSTTYGEVENKMIISFKDIPKNFLEAKFIHFTTSDPKYLLEMIKQVKQNSNAILSVDTNNWFSRMKKTKEIFDIVDIAFIDKEFKELLNCKAKTKIIKLGEEGCIYKAKNKEFYQPAVVKKNVVDKLGAGDCLNGVFMNLIANGFSEEYALKKAVEVATLSIDDYGILKLKDKMVKKEGVFER